MIYRSCPGSAAFWQYYIVDYRPSPMHHCQRPRLPQPKPCLFHYYHSTFPPAVLTFTMTPAKPRRKSAKSFQHFFLFQRCSMPLAPARVPLPFCTPHSHALFFFLLLCVLALWSHPLTATPIPTAWEKESLVWKVYVHEFRPSNEILLFVSRSRLAIPSHFSTAPNLARLFFLWH